MTIFNKMLLKIVIISIILLENGGEIVEWVCFGKQVLRRDFKFVVKILIKF